MSNRVFVSAVVLLWLASMSWLVVEKVLPSFYDGKPPVASGLAPCKPAAWEVKWSGRPVGWAASLRSVGVLGTMEVHNRVVLENVPLLDLAPSWMRHMVGDFGDMTFDTRTRLEFDGLGNFSSFRSRVAINGVPSVLNMSGKMSDSHLELKVKAGDVTYRTPIYIPHQAALAEALFPDARLPHLYVGRRWQKEEFSPFQPPSSPVELVEARVVACELLERDGGHVRVMRVEVRGTPGPGMPEDARLKAVLWVEPKSGLVLRQDVFIVNSTLRFDRLPEREAYRIGLEFFPHEKIETPEPDEGSGQEVMRNSGSKWMGRGQAR